MIDKAAIRAEADRLRAAFEARGAEPLEFDILQPAGALLDLYGEDIRTRAFTTTDPVVGEVMLRPDFTVPLVRRLVDSGRTQGRFTYAGEVFRRQEDRPDRPAEYLQAGYEVIGADDPAEADADVFATLAEMLAPLPLAPVTGDIGLLRAAVAGLRTTSSRRAALLHHLWRPTRFRALLTRFAGQSDDPARDALLAGKPPYSDAAEIGKRSTAEIEARLSALREDRAAPPLPSEDVAQLGALFAIDDTLPAAIATLSDLSREMRSIAPAVGALQRRADALSARGVTIDTLAFQTGYGLGTLEYYDGFVFGFAVATRPDLPPVATGGRYDALTRALSGGNGMTAVGGVIRPGLALEVTP